MPKWVLNMHFLALEFNCFRKWALIFELLSCRYSHTYHSSSMFRRVTKKVGEGRGGLPCPFSKIGKKCPNLWGKNALIVVIYG